MSKKIKIGLFGFGCVGQGLFHVLHETKGVKAEILKIVVKDKSKNRSLPSNWFSFDKNDILENNDINLVIELIDNAEDAYEIVKTALQNGKNVVTANKKMLAAHLQEFIELQQKHNVSLLYEASVCGSIPIIRNLEEYYNNDLLNGVHGIFNGSTNYILSKIFNENSDYSTALKNAQNLGFAESDPKLDVEAYDPLYKLVITTVHSFGLLISPNEVFNFGITTLHENDFKYAFEKSKKIKLIANVERLEDNKVALFVFPRFIDKDDFLYNIENEYNAVNIQAAFSDKQLLIGKGAGGNPTAAAVLSDIAALVFDYKYEYKKINQLDTEYTTDILIEIYFRYNSDEDLDNLNFDSISEKHYSSNFKYVIGEINLKSLIENKAYILENQLFIAHTGKKIKLKEVEKALLYEYN